MARTACSSRSSRREFASVDLHRHPSWQETFVVMEGRFDFDVAGERCALGPGEVLVIPRGAPHGFMCTSPQPGRLLTISTPAGVFEAFVVDVSAGEQRSNDRRARCLRTPWSSSFTEATHRRPLSDRADARRLAPKREVRRTDTLVLSWVPSVSATNPPALGGRRDAISFGRPGR